MKLALDTDVAVEVISGRRPHFRAWLEQAEASGASLHLSTIVFHELMCAAMGAPNPGREMDRVGWLASQMEVEAWTPEDAIEAARIRADLGTSEKVLGTMDALLAGQALNGGWTLVTGNLRAFIRVPALQLVDWSDPEGPLDRATAWMRLMRKPPK